MKFKSQVYTQASGSVGGLCYSHNRGGMYTRSRAIPTNPGSPQQVAIRGFVATLTSLWNNVLTPTQRTAWDTYAEAVPLLNALGEPINVGGLAMYVRSNVPRLQAALDRVDDGPSVFNLGEFTNPTWANVDATGGDGELGYDNSDEWADETGSAMLILVSRGQNPAVNYFKGPYRFAGLVAGLTGTPPTSPETITLPFAVIAGQSVFAQVRVTRADGRLSLPFRLGAVAS